MNINFKENWPAIRSWLYRFFRGAFATAASETVFLACNQLIDKFDILQCYVVLKDKWSDPKQAGIMLSVAFASGFVVALGKALRDSFGGASRGTEPTLLEKVSPI